MSLICETTFSRRQLEEISALSIDQNFQLWYDAKQNNFSVNLPSSADARWILDVETYETPEFIAEITKVVINSVIE